LTIHPEGRLEISMAGGPSEQSPIYQVGFIRLGGGVGVPSAEEVTNQTGLTVAVQDSGTTPWFRYRGWRLQLSAQTQWNLSVGGEITGSLIGLDIASLSIDGTGALRLGVTSHLVPIAVRGNVSLIIPDDAAVEVLGNARVPEGWETSAGGSKSPVAGEGWLISVAEGASLVIIAA
jgi:hypothetical protein